MTQDQMSHEETEAPEHVNTSALRDAIYWIVDGFEREHDCTVTMIELTTWHIYDTNSLYKDCIVHAERKR